MNDASQTDDHKPEGESTDAPGLVRAPLTPAESEFARERKDDTAFCRAVELGHDQTGDADRLAELPHLTDRVLSGRPLHGLAGADRANPEALRRPPQGGVGWTMTVRRTLR